jgi:peptide/nickel transport system substrate-binding protein
MLRGFRWQLLVLIMALVLFVASMLTRITAPDEPVPDSIDQAVPTVVVVTPATATPQQIEVIAPSTIGETQLISTFREALVGNIQRLNPLLAELNPVDRDITSLIFEGLTRTNQYGEAEPALAKSWVISADGLEYIVELRQDVLWQDGIPFSAADVLYTVSLLQSADFPGDPELGAFWRTIEIQRLGDYLIRFRLTQPLGSFLDVLRIGILPEHALRGTTAAQITSHPFNLTPIGTGPYQLEAIRSSSGNRVEAVDLRSTPVYRFRPEGQTGYSIERISFRLYDTFETALSAIQSGDVDALAGRTRAQRAALLSKCNVNPHTALQPTLGALIFNWAKDSTRFFREQRTRIALQMGLDRASIIERYLSNEVVPADSPLFPGSWAYEADLAWPPPNVDAARQMIENMNIQPASPEATEEPSSTAGSGKFGFSILTPDDPKLVSVAQEIAAQWSQLNITVTVDSVDATTYQSRLESGDFDSALVELSLGDSADPDVYHFWDSGQYPDGKNYGGMDDRRIAELLERARRDPNGINRIILYDEFQRDFIERAIAIPLYYPLYTYAVAPQIEGVQLGFIGSPASRFSTIKDWTVAPASQ